MKTLLSLLTVTVILTFATGCVTVKREEPTATRTTTVTAPAAPATVSTSTTTY